MEWKKRYPGGKKKAVTFSYDDGVEQDIRLTELFRKYGVKATFNLNSGLDESGSWNFKGVEVRRIPFAQMPEVYRGQEIACHASTHPNLEELSPRELHWELWNDRKTLESRFECTISGMALPYGTWNSQVREAIEKLGFSFCRTVESTHTFERPKDFLLWGATCHHADPQLMELAAKFRQTQEELALFYIWGHAYEFEGDQNWQVMEELLQMLSQDPDIWYATNGEVTAYFHAMDQLCVGEGFACNPSQQDLWIEKEGKALCIPAGEWVEL